MGRAHHVARGGLHAVNYAARLYAASGTVALRSVRLFVVR